jgi:hypothetical protein
MSPTNKSKAKIAAENWKSPGSAHELDEVEQMAHGIINDRSDLLPSVERIMSAPLGADDRLRALTLFHDALHNPGDPNRDPRVAIGHFLPDAPVT